MTEEQQPGGPGPQEEGKPEADAKKLPPQGPRPKMTLDEQATFLSRLLSRCVMHSGDLKGRFAGEATLTLTTEDMLRLETVQQTLAIFDMEGAAELVRDAIWRKRQKGRGRG